MNLFQNGYKFNCVIPLDPPDMKRIPYTKVDMQIPGSTPVVPVIGKFDTGAFKTMLSFDVAQLLGISNPKKNCLKKDVAKSASGHDIPYYVHQVLVCVQSEVGMNVRFIIYPGFATNLETNLFGVDWVDHFCVALDSSRVHLLRD